MRILFLGKQCVCGYGNGQIKLWDLKQCSIVWQYDNNSEGDGAMNNNNKCISMCLNDEQTLIACGSADGNCRVLNLNNGKLLSSFSCFQPSTSSSKPSIDEEEEEDDDDDEEDDESTATTIESVAFGTGHLLICGTLSGYIYIWDINTKQLRTTLNLQSGIVKFLLNDGYLLYTACLDGHIRLLDIRNGEPLKEWKSGGGQGCEIMDMIITKDKRYLLCAYMQGLCRLFKLKE
jgi:WD40 repeat protein